LGGKENKRCILKVKRPFKEKKETEPLGKVNAFAQGIRGVIRPGHRETEEVVLFTRATQARKDLGQNVPISGRSHR